MEHHLRRARERARELETLLRDPAILADRSRLAQLAKEHAELRETLARVDELTAVQRARSETQATVRESSDGELRAMAEHELHQLDQRERQLSTQILDVLDPPDPRDRKDIVIEIRSGVGGDEAALFASELLRMYLRYAERHGWQSQLVSQSRTPLGGFKEVIIELTGGPIFRDLKYESGVHRVQRVPATEKSGRVHTSTATVVVLPEADPIDVQIDPKDLEITATTSSGHGGQSVNTTYSAIRLLHRPTGLVVTCQDERSQVQNREKALRILRARLQAQQEETHLRDASTIRRSLIGGGERSEKIRTYNFPQDRVTDHRLKQNFHGLGAILDGNLDPVIERLKAVDAAQRRTSASDA